MNSIRDFERIGDHMENIKEHLEVINPRDDVISTFLLNNKWIFLLP